MDSESLYDVYNQFFRVIQANTPELLDEVYRLRFQVYCFEHQFENPDEFPDGRERDAYDAHSIHSLLIHEPSGAIAGTVRLILPRRENPGASLPIDHVCNDQSLHDPAFFNREHAAEVSRFAFAKTFRRRIGEQGSPSGVTEESLQAMDAAASFVNNKRITNHLTLGLISSLIQMSAEHRIFVWYSVMERALLRLLTRIGIHFTNIGPEIDYHGKRQPCYAFLDTLLERVREERPDVWEVLTEKGRYWKPRASAESIPKSMVNVLDPLRRRQAML